MTNKMVWIVAAIALGVLIGAALTYYYDNYFASPNPTPGPSPGQLITPVDQADLNWAGFTVASDFSNPQPVVTGVSGSWVVPQVEISQSDTFSAVWVGIGGFFGHTLIQTGTEQDCVNGTLYYSAWYELLPNDAVTITTIDVSPGDAINASINLVNSLVNLWSISISDLSTGQSFSQDFFYGSSKLSAEWIVERPDIGSSDTNLTISTIANFGSVTFSNCRATIGNELKTFGYFPSIRLFMHDQKGARLADTSNYNSDGSSFTVTYR